mmetsp:Transcript_7902/g.9051  ORF Transcript_7902/g.9051 Transcript_7902/m.9051 type:complete len:300 (-) Transcript_7902:343-1242(-)
MWTTGGLASCRPGQRQESGCPVCTTHFPTAESEGEGSQKRKGSRTICTRRDRAGQPLHQVLGARGLAKSMRTLRPRRILPLSKANLSTDSSASNSTKPHPLKSPLSLSVSHRILAIGPQSPVSANLYMASSSMSYDRLPTKHVLQPSGFSLIGLSSHFFLAPPPPGLGVAKSTLIGRPMRSSPFLATAMAAASGVSKVMNPHPLNLPDSRSVSQKMSVVSPQSLKNAFAASSSMSQLRFPQKILDVAVGLLAGLFLLFVKPARPEGAASSSTASAAGSSAAGAAASAATAAAWAALADL